MTDKGGGQSRGEQTSQRVNSLVKGDDPRRRSCEEIRRGDPARRSTEEIHRGGPTVEVLRKDREVFEDKRSKRQGRSKPQRLKHKEEV